MSGSRKIGARLNPAIKGLLHRPCWTFPATTVAFLISTGAFAGSANPENAAAEMSVVDARGLIERALLKDSHGNSSFDLDASVDLSTHDDSTLIGSVRISPSALIIGTRKNGVTQCALKGLGAIDTHIYLVGRYITFHCVGKTGMLTLLRYSRDDVNRLAKALTVLKFAANLSLPPDQDTVFQAVVSGYRAAALKPEFPEEARKFKLQAEDAIKQSQFQDAADLFQQTLEIAPWWPEGHFNRALVLGNIGDFEGAVNEMQRYLALVPEAPDARAAQDKVYVWQRKM